MRLGVSKSGFDFLQALVGGVEIEGSGVPGASEPFCEFFVAFVGGVGEGSEEFGVTINAAAIFGRAGIFAGQTDGGRELRIGREDFFDSDFMEPTVAKVVLIFEFAFGRGGDLGEGGALFVANIEVGIGCAVESAGGARSDDKVVQMGVGPAHGDLDDMMEAVESEAGGDQDAAPDGRFEAGEGDFQLAERGLGSSVLNKLDHVVGWLFGRWCRIGAEGSIESAGCPGRAGQGTYSNGG